MQLKNIQIRRAESSDCSSIGLVHYRAHKLSFKEFTEESWIRERDLKHYREYWCKYLSEQPVDELTFVGILGEMTVGTVTIIPASQSSAAFIPRYTYEYDDPEISCIRLMYVDPDHQRNGIGTELIRVATRKMVEQGNNIGTLITHAANKGSRRYYESHGWVLDEVFERQVEEFFPEPQGMRKRARYRKKLVAVK